MQMKFTALIKNKKKIKTTHVLIGGQNLMIVLICKKCKALYYAYNKKQKHYCNDIEKQFKYQQF